MKLTIAQGNTLLKTAREFLKAKLSNNPFKKSVPGPIFLEPRGVFVTLTKNNELRGCIGHPYPDSPLINAVLDSAKMAALEDPRFEPVTAAELPSLKIEITVLTVPTPIKPEQVIAGTHGLIAKKGAYSGLLLPQVPVEWGWSREEFLSHTCSKAGLSPDEWRDGSVEFLGFEGQIFSEK